MRSLLWALLSTLLIYSPANTLAQSQSNQPAGSSETSLLNGSVIFDDSADSWVLNFQKWKRSELEQVQRLIERADIEQHGIVQLATAGTPLHLRRASDADLAEQTGVHETLAGTGVNTITFSDSFFSSEDQHVILIHELTHAADTGCHIAYSRPFVESILPTMKGFRLLEKENPNPFNLTEFGITYRICAYQQMRVNLKEALAHVFAGFAEAKGYPMSQSTALRLLRPSDADVSWQAAYRRGMSAFEHANYSEAIKEFQAALKIDDSAPMGHVQLARCYFHQHRQIVTLSEIKIAVKLFEDLGIDLTEPNALKSKKMLANALYANNQIAPSAALSESMRTFENVEKASRSKVGQTQDWSTILLSQ